MCGVAGIYIPQPGEVGDSAGAALARMGQHLHPRGPDASGTQVRGRAALQHTRLAIIDVDPRSNQPMESADWLLSYNGEIYNFRALRRELSDGHDFQTTGDTEVLLAALQRWGLEQTLQRCAGMYAFLAYHKPSGVLYAARDRLGIKPLYFTRQPDGATYLASTAGALLKALPGVVWQEYRPAVASYFILGAPFTTMSVHDGIERLEPAHFLRLNPDGTQETKRYWAPQYTPGFSLEQLVDIVREHQVSDVKSALFLSGGVDSTFLAAAMDGMDCFHLLSPELPYAEAVAQRYRRKLVVVNPELSGYEDGITRACQLHGEPLMSCGIPQAVSRAVADSGYKMAISANGADELFLGYPRTPAPEYRPAFLPLHELPSYQHFADQVSHIFRDSRGFSIEAYADCLPTLQEIASHALENFHLPGFPPSASHRWFELMTYVLHDLNPTLDAASMANSVEVRVPFLDHRVVEGVLSWDASALITPGDGRKAPLKRFLGSDFPLSFFNRTKMGFSISPESLSHINEATIQSFEKHKGQGFIRIDAEMSGPHHDRDLIYLRNSLHVFDLWRAGQTT